MNNMDMFSQDYILNENQNKVLKNTYMLLATTFIPTVFGSLLGVNFITLFFGAAMFHPIVFSLMFLAIFYGLFFAIELNRNNSLGVGLLYLLTFLMGISLGPILSVALAIKNGGELIALAGFGTAIIFFVFAGIASVTKKDFSGMAKFLMVGSIVLMLMVVANIFLNIQMMQLVIAGMFLIFSSLMILFNISQIIHGGETNYIMATLSLYMNIYNIFVSLLRLLISLGSSRD
jgi:FtsH-binding integral membrane protein